MTRTHCWLVGIIATTTGAFGCSAGPTESPPVIGLDVHGTVTDQLTGNTIYGARVVIGHPACTGSNLTGWTCDNQILASVTTGSDGQYHAKHHFAACGPVGFASFYSFEVIADGYQDQDTRLWPTPRVLVCTAPTQTLNLVLVPLPPSAAGGPAR